MGINRKSKKKKTRSGHPWYSPAMLDPEREDPPYRKPAEEQPQSAIAKLMTDIKEYDRKPTSINGIELRARAVLWLRLAECANAGVQVLEALRDRRKK